MTIRNLTPHVINVLGEDNRVLVEIPPEPSSARAAFDETPLHDVHDVGEVPIVGIDFRGFEALPDPVPGVWIVVSSVVANLAPLVGRSTVDMLTPHRPVRDDAGQIIGCRALAKVPR